MVILNRTNNVPTVCTRIREVLGSEASEEAVDSVAVEDSVEDPGAEVPVEEVEPPAVFNSLFYSFTHSFII